MRPWSQVASAALWRALTARISYNTLRTQLSRLYRKLGVQIRVGVAVVVFNEALKIVVESQAPDNAESGAQTADDQPD